MLRLIKLAIVTLILLLFAGCHWFRSPCDMPVPVSGEVLEKEFTSPEGRFKIDLPPGKPSPREPGQSAQTTTFRWLILNSAHYYVTYFDLDRDVEQSGESVKMLVHFRDQLLAKRPGRLEVDKVLMLSGHPGREVVIKDENGTGINRFYVAGSRIYSVAAYIPVRLNCALPGAIKTLDSFELIGDNTVGRNSHQP